MTEVFSGASHSLCATESGDCSFWGKNNQGQCGHGTTADVLVSTLVISALSTSVGGTVVEDGNGGSSGGGSSNSGGNSHGGEGGTADCPTVQIAGGWEHTLALDAQGRLFSFGSGYKDSRRSGLPPVLGHGDHERELFPRQILALQDKVVVHVACGWDHSLAVTDHGLLYAWGAGTNGKLGHGDEGDRAVPTLVASMSGVFVVQAEAGCEHSIAISLNGELYSWGHGDSGRLGHGDDKTQNIPKQVALVNGEFTKVVSVAVGDKYNLILVAEDEERMKERKDKKEQQEKKEQEAEQ